MKPAKFEACIIPPINYVTVSALELHVRPEKEHLSLIFNNELEIET